MLDHACNLLHPSRVEDVACLFAEGGGAGQRLHRHLFNLLTDQRDQSVFFYVFVASAATETKQKTRTHQLTLQLQKQPDHSISTTDPTRLNSTQHSSY